MKIINLDIINEKLYYDKLDNGLDVYIIRKKDFNNNFVSFTTNFGGLDVSFVPINENKVTKMPSGIAHFLEHKLFEQKDGISPHQFYKKSGTYINAMTGYNRTKYIFSGPNNFEENLNFLLDFVQSPYFTDENVKKEKGIILQEKHMCSDDKNRLFFETILNNLFNKIPYKYSVIGTIKDINSITKEELYKCYNTFYHPSNMALFIVTNMEEEKVLNIVKNNQSKKEFIKNYKVNKEKYYEDVKVRKEYEEIISDVEETRVGYSIKIKNNYNYSKRELEDYIYIYFSILIGNLSSFNIKLKKEKIISDNISFQADIIDEFIIINIYALSNNYKKFIKLLEEELKNKKFNKKLFDLYKKNIISDFYYLFNSVSGTLSFMESSYELDKEVSNKTIEEENNLNYNDFKKLIDKLNFDNKSIVVMKNK